MKHYSVMQGVESLKVNVLSLMYDVGDSLHRSPLERSYKAKVLMHFPSNVDWNPFDEDAVRMVRLLNNELNLNYPELDCDFIIQILIVALFVM